MEVSVKQISCMEKVLPGDPLDMPQVNKMTVLGGETISYQIALKVAGRLSFTAKLSSPWGRLYGVYNTVMDLPAYDTADGDYITKQPGIMPDMLLPIADEADTYKLSYEAGALWVTVTVPENTPAGTYTVDIDITADDWKQKLDLPRQTMTLEVIGKNLPRQELKFTQWFYADCIADAHGVAIYSQEHWDLIDKYMQLARELGVNMLLTPVITPPLDTQVGHRRPNTQLVKMEKAGDRYRFDFTLLQRWLELCRKNGIEFIEVSHLFSQWGLAYAPNIWVTENGAETLLFGWHTPAKSPEYKAFLGQFLPALVAYLSDNWGKDKCFFHISDEPHAEHIEAYQYAHDVIVPLLDGCQTIDALSEYEFYEKGLVEVPVTKTDRIEPFLAHKLKRQWAYYCCSQNVDVGNRYFAQPSYRNRILGLQLYKFGIEGFLHWGYNFYYSRRSLKKIDPFLTSSGDKGFPSGDAFSVYPVDGGAVPSLRAVVFHRALQDIAVCRALEAKIGKAEVIKMIDDAAGEPLTFANYPRRSDFVPQLIEKMKELLN